MRKIGRVRSANSCLDGTGNRRMGGSRQHRFDFAFMIGRKAMPETKLLLAIFTSDLLQLAPFALGEGAFVLVHPHLLLARDDDRCRLRAVRQRRTLVGFARAMKEAEMFVAPIVAAEREKIKLVAEETLFSDLGKVHCCKGL